MGIFRFLEKDRKCGTIKEKGFWHSDNVIFLFHYFIKNPVMFEYLFDITDTTTRVLSFTTNNTGKKKICEELASYYGKFGHEKFFDDLENSQSEEISYGLYEDTPLFDFLHSVGLFDPYFNIYKFFIPQYIIPKNANRT
jgi:hypothetical protein